MVRATRKMHKRVGVVFDFDDTLAADTVSGMVSHFGLEADRFWDEVRQWREQGWEPVLAAMYQLVRISRARQPEDRITRERIREFGRDLKLFPGVENMFDTLVRKARSIVPDVEVQFYVISAGLEAIIQATPIARFLSGIYACRFHYDKEGAIEFPAQLVSHTQKTHFLRQISHGIPADEKKAFWVSRHLDYDEYDIPFDHMVYIGDGLTDIPCFSVMRAYGGWALGIHKDTSAKKWGEQAELSSGEKVDNLAPADYAPESELMRSLVLCVEIICKRIALGKMSRKD